jgi:serine/threonine protein kinase
MHELDFFDESPEISLLSMEGSWRSVWKVTTANNSNNTMILKVLQLDREFDAESYEIHALDSIVMERLTASPYVVSSFGHCGQSVLTEFAQSSGRNLLKDTTLSGRSRVRLALDLARGLAELHALQPLDFGSSSSKKSRQPQPQRNTKNHTTGMQQLVFAHHDINIANIISLEPKAIQWNDFNLGIMSRQERTTATTPFSSCPVPIRFASPMWRSPEEIANATGTLPTEGGGVQASDVYSLGNIFFAILTTQQPWNHLEEDKKTDEDIRHAKLQGQGPNLPTKLLTPPKAESQVLYEAMQACLRFEASQRPTAWQLALALGTAYKWFQQPKETLVQPTSAAIRQLFAISID